MISQWWWHSLLIDKSCEFGSINRSVWLASAFWNLNRACSKFFDPCQRNEIASYPSLFSYQRALPFNQTLLLRLNYIQNVWRMYVEPQLNCRTSKLIHRSRPPSAVSGGDPRSWGRCCLYSPRCHYHCCPPLPLYAWWISWFDMSGANDVPQLPSLSTSSARSSKYQ